MRCRLSIVSILRIKSWRYNELALPLEISNIYYFKKFPLHMFDRLLDLLIAVDISITIHKHVLGNTISSFVF